MHYKTIDKYARENLQYFNTNGADLTKKKLVGEGMDVLDAEDVIDRLETGLDETPEAAAPFTPSEAPTPAPVPTPAAAPVKQPKAPKATAPQSKSNVDYEQWKIETIGGVQHKVRKIKDVRIGDERAARLNKHASNSGVAYFKIS